MTSPDYWAFHPTTGLFTRLLGFAPDCWALHPTIGLFTQLLGFAPDYWALHPTTGLFTRLLGISRTTGPSSKNQCLTLMAGMPHFHPLNIVIIYNIGHQWEVLSPRYCIAWRLEKFDSGCHFWQEPQRIPTDPSLTVRCTKELASLTARTIEKSFL